MTSDQVKYGSWCSIVGDQQVCQIIDTPTLWGEILYRAWLSGSDTVVRIPASKLKPLESEEKRS